MSFFLMSLADAVATRSSSGFDWTLFCTAIGSFATAAGVVVLWFGFKYTNKQIKIAQEANTIVAWIEAERIFCDEQATYKYEVQIDGAFKKRKAIFRDFRGIICGFAKEMDGREWEKDNDGFATYESRDKKEIVRVSYREAKKVCGNLNLCAAFALRGGAMDAEYFEGNWADPYRKAWIVLNGVVLHEREGRPGMWPSFEKAGRVGLAKLGWPENKKYPSEWRKAMDWEKEKRFAKAEWKEKIILCDSSTKIEMNKKTGRIAAAFYRIVP